MNSIDLIKKHEGLRLKPYTCTAGKLSIGYGRNLDDVGISQETADQMLEEDMVSVRVDCLKFGWFHGLNQARQAVVENMLFNLGFRRFSGFKKTIGFIEDGLYHKAAEEMLDSKWARQVGNRAKELSLMMETGEFKQP